MAFYNILNKTPQQVKVRLIPVSKDYLIDSPDLETLDMLGNIKGIVLETSYGVSCDGAISYGVMDAVVNEGTTTNITNGNVKSTITGDATVLAETLEDDYGFKATVLTKWNDPNA